MKKSTKKNIVLTIAVILVAALVVGIFVMLFGDRAPGVPDNPSDVTDVPDVPDDEWQDVPDSSGEFTVMYGTEMTFTPESMGQLMLPQEGNVLFQITGTSKYNVKVISNLDDGQGDSRPYFYYVDDKLALFSNDDYTAEFIEEFSATNFFYIDCHEAGYYSLESVLGRMHGTDNIELHVPADMQYPYKMVITSAKGEEIIIELGQKK